jgi:hypothetical protein
MLLYARAGTSPYKLQNYVTGRWITGDGDGQMLYDAVTGDPVAAATTKGLDFSPDTGIRKNGWQPGVAQAHLSRTRTNA